MVNKLIKTSKDTLKLGIGSMAGMGVMGSIPGMPAQAIGVEKAVGAGLGVLNIGQLGKSGMVVVDQVKSSVHKAKPKKYINKNKKIEDLIGF